MATKRKSKAKPRPKAKLKPKQGAKNGLSAKPRTEKPGQSEKRKRKSQPVGQQLRKGHRRPLASRGQCALEPPKRSNRRRVALQRRFHQSSASEVVTHYYSHLSVVAMQLEPGAMLRVGDLIHIWGHTTDFTQRVESLEVNHAPVPEVGPKDDFGLKVIEHAREHDIVFKVRS